TYSDAVGRGPAPRMESRATQFSLEDLADPSQALKQPVGKQSAPVNHMAGDIVHSHTKDGFSKVQIPSLDATLREVLDQMLKRRKGLLRSLGPEFHVENHKEVGIPIDLDTTIRSSGTLEFTLVSEDMVPSASKLEEWADRDMTAMEAHLYQAFNVAILQRIGRNTEVQLGISGEKVEITPLQHKAKSKLWGWHQKAVTHNLNEIAACEIVNRKH
ncbi:target of rapamycin complex 2 subunit MAPKAP1, partial [Ixodes scapularis]